MNTEGGTGPIADESCLTVVLTSCQYLPVSSERLPTLSQKERLILESLVDEPKFGLQLVEESGGRLKYGTVYVTLRRMEDKGYLASEQEARQPGAIGLPRRHYRPTALGVRVLNAWTSLARELAFGVQP